MNTNLRIPFWNSIAARLLKVVFGIYLIIAISMTVGHMLIEYHYQKNSISDDLQDIQHSFEQGLSLDLWQMDQSSLHSTVEGMLKIPVIVGVKIQNANNLDVAVGGIISQNNIVGNVGIQVGLLGLSQTESEIHENEKYQYAVFKHQFPIIYSYEKETKQMGTATIYSNTSVVLKRVKLGFLLLLLNAVIKTAALWLIFWWFSNLLLRRPLLALAGATQKVNLDNLDSFRMEIETSGQNELSAIESSFNSMIHNLHRSIAEQKKEEERHKTTIDSSIDGFVIVDTKGKFLNVNESYCKTSGYSRDEILNMSIMDIDVLFSQTAIEQRLKKFIRIGKDRFESKHRHKNGTIIDVEVSITYSQEDGGIFFAFLRDITARKLAEKALRESEEQYRAVADNIGDYIMRYNREYRHIYANRKAIDVTGLPVDKYIGKTHREMGFSEHLCELWEKNIQRVFDTGEQQNIAFDVELADGTMSLELQLNPEFSVDGQVQGVIGISRDVTLRKKMEAQLQQAQKMESIGTLAGGIAHDFNNILFPIVGNTELLLEDIPNDSPLRGNLNEVFKGAMRAKDLVKQILEFSRQDSHEVKLMRMQPIINEALALIRSTIPTSIEVVQSVSTDCGAIKADPTQIHQVVMNLATNAYHAMEDTGGELRVNLKEIELGQQDLPTADMEPGSYACLIVTDTGIGIDKHVRASIFDPYFTTKEQGKGTGMGLSVVHGIILNAGGNIQVYSELGKGTEFHVYLPVVQSAFRQKGTLTKEPIQGGTEQILIVDDEEAIVFMEKQMLERLGYSVISRTSSVEALDAFRQNPDKFDLVISDMTMPNMNGDKLAYEMIRIRPDIPVLLCTGFSEKIPKEKAASMGIKGLLMKPIVKKELSEKIREVLDN